MKNGGSFHSFLYVYQRVKGLQLLVFSAHVRMFGRIVKNFVQTKMCFFGHRPRSQRHTARRFMVSLWTEGALRVFCGDVPKR